MKNIFFALIAIILMSCVSSVESKAIVCGSNHDSDRILRLILERKDCLICLLDDVDKELKACPSDTGLNRVAMGVSNRMKKDGDIILKYYESLSSIESLTPGEIATAAYYYREKNDYKNAISNYKKSIELDDDPFVMFSLAAALYNNQQKVEAVESLKKLLVVIYPLPKTTALGESSGGAHVLFDDASNLLAEIYVSINQPDDAEVVYRNLISAYTEDDFHYPDYLLMLSQFLLTSVNPEKAKESIELKKRAELILSRDSSDMQQYRKQMGKTWLRTR